MHTAEFALIEMQNNFRFAVRIHNKYMRRTKANSRDPAPSNLSKVKSFAQFIFLQQLKHRELSFELENNRKVFVTDV